VTTKIYQHLPGTISQDIGRYWLLMTVLGRCWYILAMDGRSWGWLKGFLNVCCFRWNAEGCWKAKLDPRRLDNFLPKFGSRYTQWLRAGKIIVFIFFSFFEAVFIFLLLRVIFIFFLRSSSFFLRSSYFFWVFFCFLFEVVFHFFWGCLSSWVKIRLHAENQLPS
jgi:hypothetical protein